MPLTARQFDVLRKPLNPVRVAKRTQSGKQLSYLESWDVRAHLIRVFGYGNFNVEVLDYTYVGSREYLSQDGQKEMVEVIYSAHVRLSIHGLATYSEVAVGSASGPVTMLGEHHDNAVKTAASDALKRCAINLGTQFGLSLYDDGSTRDVVKDTLVKPDGYEEPKPTEEQTAAMAHSLGASETDPDVKS